MADGTAAPAVNDWQTVDHPRDWQTIDNAAQSKPGFFDPHASDNGVQSFLRGGAAGIKNIIAHPIDTIASMGQPLVASGVGPNGYPTTAATGNPQNSTANAAVQQQAQQGQADAAQFIKEHPAYAAGSIVGPAVATAGITKALPMAAEGFEGAMTGAKNLLSGPPEVQMTKALQPSKGNTGFSTDLRSAMPQMKAAEADLGKPIATFDDAVQANALAKKKIWAQVEPRLQQGGQAGATIDGNPIADAMMNSIDKRMALQNPGLTDRIKAIADTYRRPLGVNEAEDFIQSNNKELTGYYAKNKMSQQAAMADPEIAAKIAEGDALRRGLYSKLDNLTGPGVAQLKQAYGALSNVQKQLVDQQIVYARKAPANLGEQLGYLQAAGKVLTGDVLGGVKDIAVRRFLSDLNDKESMIARSFQNVQPAAPFPAPVSPRLAGLLQRGPIQTPPPSASPAISQAPAIDATTRAQRLGLLLPAQSGAPTILPYNPEMSMGEQAASLMHYLREKQNSMYPPTK